MAAANSSPFMEGMEKSVMTRSNLAASNLAKASLPLVAVSTTWPSNASIILTASQTKGSSSTTRMRRWGKAGTAMQIIRNSLSLKAKCASFCCGDFFLLARVQERSAATLIFRLLDYLYQTICQQFYLLFSQTLSGLVAEDMGPKLFLPDAVDGV